MKKIIVLLPLLLSFNFSTADTRQNQCTTALAKCIDNACANTDDSNCSAPCNQIYNSCMQQN